MQLTNNTSFSVYQVYYVKNHKGYSFFKKIPLKKKCDPFCLRIIFLYLVGYDVGPLYFFMKNNLFICTELLCNHHFGGMIILYLLSQAKDVLFSSILLKVPLIVKLSFWRNMIVIFLFRFRSYFNKVLSKFVPRILLKEDSPGRMVLFKQATSNYINDLGFRNQSKVRNCQIFQTE